MRILVTNDDGIDSVGLHVLARALLPLGDVTVVAPDDEYSGAGASLGALDRIHPVARRAHIDGVDTVWALSGSPALCVMAARLGAFGDPFDLVVSGVNPGANVGRAVYHSGTVGAALTARNGLVPGVAVSQSVTGSGVEGQGWDEMLREQRWETAAQVGAAVAAAVLAQRRTAPDADPVVVNVNVPNVALADVRGWSYAEVALRPKRAMADARLEPRLGHEGSFDLRLDWGVEQELPPDTDGGAVDDHRVAITVLSRLVAATPPDGFDPSASLADLGMARA